MEENKVENKGENLIDKLEDEVKEIKEEIKDEVKEIKEEFQHEAHHETKDEVKEETKKENHSTHSDYHSKKNENLWCGLAYVVFFLPLLLIPHSAKGKFHANQGLILLIVYIVGKFVLTLVPILGWILLPFFIIFMVVLFVIGLTNGFSGKEKKLPVIGNMFDLIK